MAKKKHKQKKPSGQSLSHRPLDKELTEANLSQIPSAQTRDMLQEAYPDHPTARNLRQAEIKQLQSKYGNAFVQRYLASYEKENISSRISGTQSNRQAPVSLQRDDVTSSQITETTDTGNKYTQELALNKTKAKITIYLAVKWVKKGTWTNDDAYQKFIRKVKTAAYDYMDNKFKVVCTPVAKGAGTSPIELPIDFIIYDIDSGYEIEAVGGKPGGGSYMSQAGGKLYEYEDNVPEINVTYAHEFGHAMLGASDEYANPKVPGRVLTNDHSLMANYYAQGKDTAEFKARHFQHIVKEVAKAFAGYTCGIKKM